MPNANRNLGGFVGPVGDPTKVSIASADLFAPGQLGTVIAVKNTSLVGSSGTTLTTKWFQFVQLHSGSATTVGACVVWTDYSGYVVSTVSSNTRQNDVAGLLNVGTITGAVATSLATAGQFVWILVGGLGVALVENAQTPAVGDSVIQGATTAGRAGLTAEGTAPTAKAIGTFLNTKTTAHFGSGTLPADTCVVYLYPPLGV